MYIRVIFGIYVCHECDLLNSNLVGGDHLP